MVLPVVFYILGTIAVLSAIVTVTTARFFKPVACLLAVAGGLAPWIVILMWHKWIPGSALGTIVGMLGGGPLFMASFLHFGMGRKPRAWTTVATASMLGSCSGIGFGIFLYRFFSGLP
ncbi:MAG: hypothetical protein EOP88_16105 [Verrucomicrobiaceae bacterium]|nr:MAG: hypothetical protein EOP88_16105 [Verrucomicrobiaceae bacterium]